MEATTRPVKHLGDGIAVGNLGNACNDLAAAAPGRPQNCYTRGGMGMGSSLGLGLAVAQPGRRVVVPDGDGSLLTNLGSLATIATVAPRNLIHVVWGNEQYQLTGGESTATAKGVDLAGMARAAGYRQVFYPQDEDEFGKVIVEALGSDGPTFVWAKVAPGKMRGIGTHE